MEKEAILADLNKEKEKLRQARQRLSNLEDQYETLEEFTRECNDRIRAFEESMQRRKNKLLTLDNLWSKVKSAVRYKEKMNEMLVGAEFTRASTAIGDLENSTSAKKRSIRNDIGDVEAEIARLERSVEMLQNTYNTYSEEADK